jgi:hypothetical protein
MRKNKQADLLAVQFCDGGHSSTSHNADENKDSYTSFSNILLNSYHAEHYSKVTVSTGHECNPPCYRAEALLHLFTYK